jgi:tetratricopeptide (TPR) repeat protein
MAAATEDLDAKIRLIGQALVLHPNEPGLVYTLADALKSRQDAPGALAAAERLRALAPRHAGGWLVRGWALRQLAQLDGAVDALRTCLRLAPDRAEAAVLLGDTLLLLGDYAAGFPLFERRFDAYPAYRDMAAMFGPHLWRPGMAVAGKRVMISAEQGLGDCIQNVRFLPDLARLGATVMLGAAPKLWRLFAPYRAVAAFRDTAALGRDVDLVVPLASLPACCGATRDTLPAAEGYLSAEPDLVAAWRGKLAGPGLKIGLNWQGNPAGNIDRGRSLPLAAFAPLFALPNVRLIALQKNVGTEQIGADMPVARFDLDTGADAFVDTAALMAALDLIVTTDTSIAHLAGALGVPALVLLKRVPDWRWGLQGETTPWYGSLRLIRQTSDGVWDDVIARVVAIAAEKATARR